jgi:hypothetical protein
MYQKKGDRQKGLKLLQREKQFIEFIAATPANLDHPNSADGAYGQDALFHEIDESFDSPAAPPPKDRGKSSMMLEAKKRHGKGQAAADLKKLNEITMMTLELWKVMVSQSSPGVPQN